MSDEEFELQLAVPNEESRKLGKIVRQIVAHRMGLPKTAIRPDSSFRDLSRTQWDGGDAVELVLELERTFGIAIPDADAEKISTVRQLIGYVAQADFATSRSP